MKQVKSLLIIDDCEADIELISMALEDTGLFPYVFSAKDAEEGLRLFTDYERTRLEHPEHFPPVVVLLDINMPRMDGYQFLEEYEKLSAQSPLAQGPPSIILMVTSSTDPLDRARAQRFGMVRDFLSKPVTREDARRIAERFGV